MEACKKRKTSQGGQRTALIKMGEGAGEFSNASRNDGSGGRKKEKKPWLKKKRYQEYQTPKFKGVTPDLKGNYIATHQEVPDKAKTTHKNTMQALERHACRTCLHPQYVADFFEKGIRPVLKEPEEPKGKIPKAKEAM